jgi:hypothetical protein
MAPASAASSRVPCPARAKSVRERLEEGGATTERRGKVKSYFQISEINFAYPRGFVEIRFSGRLRA